MEGFKASSKAAELIIRSRWNPPDLPPQLNFTSRRAPFQGTELDLAQAAIGERLVRLLGTVARQHIARKPDADKVRIMTSEPLAFVRDVELGLRRRLGLSESKEPYRDAMMRLAAEFYQWIQLSAAECKQLGLEFDPKTRDVFIRCPDSRPTVSPLEDR